MLIFQCDEKSVAIHHGSIQPFGMYFKVLVVHSNLFSSIIVE